MLSRRNKSHLPKPKPGRKVNLPDDAASVHSGVSHLIEVSDSRYASFKGTLDSIRSFDREVFEEMTSLAKPHLVGGRNPSFDNVLILLNNQVRDPHSDGVLSTYYFRIDSDHQDKDKYKVAALKHPDNQILLLQKPIEKSSALKENPYHITEMEICFGTDHSRDDTLNEYFSSFTEDKPNYEVLIGKLPLPVCNDFLQHPKMLTQRDSGEFTPFFTHVEVQDDDGEFKMTGKRALLMYNLAIEETYRSTATGWQQKG